MKWVIGFLLMLNIIVGGSSLYVSYVTYENVNLVGAILWGIINNQGQGQSG